MRSARPASARPISGPAAIDPAISEVATPSWPLRLPGVAMAGFRASARDVVEMSVIPYPAITLFIDIRDGITLAGSGSGSARPHRGSVVTGIAPHAVIRGSGRNVECLQVRLSPVLAPAVLDASREIGGTVAPFESLWGADAGRFQERLRAARSWDERFALAEAALGQRVEAGRTVSPEVAFAWRQMARYRGRVRIEDVAAQTGWSRKRLWSRFRSQAGLTPKRAAQLIRFDHAAHRLAAGVSPADVAAGTGYVDQSHLHRDVMTFTGLTPTAVASAPWLAVDPVAWTAPGYLTTG